MRDHNISQRRVCDLVGVDPKTVRRERLADHADIRKKMHEIAEKRRRFGYRRIGIMLEREGFAMNEKKLYRLYKEEGLSVRRRRGRKRARGTRAPMPIPNRPNVRWSLDFVSDTFGASRKFRILAVNDDCTRENLGLIADTITSTSFSSPNQIGSNVFFNPATYVNGSDSQPTNPVLVTITYDAFPAAGSTRTGLKYIFRKRNNGGAWTVMKFDTLPMREAGCLRLVDRDSFIGVSFDQNTTLTEYGFALYMTTTGAGNCEVQNFICTFEQLNRV